MLRVEAPVRLEGREAALEAVVAGPAGEAALGRDVSPAAFVPDCLPDGAREALVLLDWDHRAVRPAVLRGVVALGVGRLVQDVVGLV